VIAPSTAFSYKGKHIDVKQIGRELGVRYVLEGSVQRSGNRLRLNVQLIDAESSAQLWVERLDRDYGELFAMQDEIVTRLARSLDVELIALEARRAENSVNPNSMDLNFRAWAMCYQGANRVVLTQARALFEQALALDRSNVEALVGLAYNRATAIMSHLSEDRVNDLKTAERAATSALSVAPNHAWAHFALGCVYSLSNRFLEAIAEYEHAIGINSNLALAHGYIALAKFYSGRAEEVDAHLAEFFRLSPRDAILYLAHFLSGVSKVFLGRYDEAIASLRRSIEANRNYPLARFYLAAALANEGRITDAQTVMKEGLALDPGFSIRRYRAEAMSANPVYLAQREHMYVGLREAGLPEG
jgi:tetratricopeptide (TPR) repeat protein